MFYDVLYTINLKGDVRHIRYWANSKEEVVKLINNDSSLTISKFISITPADFDLL